MRLILLVFTFFVAAADAFATELKAPVHARSFTVTCAASINAWVEVDTGSIHTREAINSEAKKRVLVTLTGSMPYRGDSVLCSYATRRRDITTSYSIRCLQPRKERGYKHTYLCH